MSKDKLKNKDLNKVSGGDNQPNGNDVKTVDELIRKTEEEMLKVRSTGKRPLACPNCNSVVLPGFKYCLNCGYKFPD